MPVKAGLTTLLDRTATIADGLRAAASTRLMVGIPAEKADRDDGTITNAAIGYIMENGSPEAHIPPRPHLVPGIKRVQPETIDGLKKVLDLALAGNPSGVERQFHRIGLRAVNSIRAVISEGIPPPLADSTLRARARRGRKGAIRELRRRNAGQAPSVDLTKPLLDTGAYRNAITYALRKAKA